MFFRAGFLAAILAATAFAGPTGADTTATAAKPTQITAANAPRDPQGWTFTVPTGFHNADASRADAQDLEDRLPEQGFEAALEARLQGLQPVLARLKPGEPFVFHIYHPNDVTEQEKNADEAAVRRVWTRLFPDRPLTVEHRAMDLLPRNYQFPKLANGDPDPNAPTAAEVANQPPPPVRTHQEKRRDPGEVRGMKRREGMKQGAMLGAIHFAAGTHILGPDGIHSPGGLMAHQVATYLADMIAEWGYKAYQTEISDWMEQKGLSIAFNLGLMGITRPAIAEALSANHIGATLDAMYFTMLIGGTAALTPQFIMGLRSLERLRQMGYMNTAERQMELLDAARWSLGTLGLMSSGVPLARWGMVLTLPMENFHYWRAKYRADTRDPIQNVFVLADPRLYRNRVDLNGHEALEATKDIRGLSNESVVEDMTGAGSAFKPIVSKGPQPGVIRWAARGLAATAVATPGALYRAARAMPRVLARALRGTPAALGNLGAAAQRLMSRRKECTADLKTLAPHA